MLRFAGQFERIRYGGVNDFTIPAKRGNVKYPSQKKKLLLYLSTLKCIATMSFTLVISVS